VSRGESGHERVVAGRAQLRKKGQLTLPPRVRAALHLSEGDEVEFTVHPDGEVTLRGLTVIPTAQKWFWTEEWQAGEREASAAIVAGNTTVDHSTEEFTSPCSTSSMPKPDADVRTTPSIRS
jgi:AbrB family looped-hinge helix DNA binding protein